MIDQAKLHESETFQLDFARVEGKVVIDQIVSIGAKLEDDFFVMDRPGQPMPWQAVSVWTADCWCGGNQVYPDESDVDRLTFDYLFASLPIEHFVKFQMNLVEIATGLGGRITYGNLLVSDTDIQQYCEVWQKDLHDELAEAPGTESLAILIQQLFYQ